jgi:hypothetical protein
MQSHQVPLRGKLGVLADANFGQRVAEQERDELSRYFVETDQWRQLLSGNVDVVYGAKGSGKSALYSLLIERADELFDNGTLIVPIEKPSGAPAFHSVARDPPTTEEAFVGLWKLYFLSLIADVLREWGVRTDASQRVYEHLEQAGLLEPRKSLGVLLKRASEYVRRLVEADAVETGVALDPGTGQPVGVSLRITLGEPSQVNRAHGCVSVDDLLADADEALRDLGFAVWLVLDRLDVAFTQHDTVERKALRALFKAYLDMQGLRHVALKLFLRSDIWARITDAGFREASHITRSLTIKWDLHALRRVVVRRLLKNRSIRDYYAIATDDLGPGEEDRFLERALPDHVEHESASIPALEWIVGATQDGTREPGPREIIHLLSAAREVQLRRVELGHPEPEREVLIEPESLRQALETVSDSRLTQTMYAEYPRLRPFVAKLEGEAHELSLQKLSDLWRLDASRASSVAEELIEVGFFERRRSKRHPNYWVPIVYRPALRLREEEGTAFLDFGATVVERTAQLVLDRIGGAQQARYVGARSEPGSEGVVLKFIEYHYRQPLSLWLFAAESGSPNSLVDAGDVLVAALLTASGRELDREDYRSRLVGGRGFRLMRHFRSGRYGYRLVVKYEDVQGRSPEYVAASFSKRILAALQQGELIDGPGRRVPRQS